MLLSNGYMSELCLLICSPDNARDRELTIWEKYSQFDTLGRDIFSLLKNNELKIFLKISVIVLNNLHFNKFGIETNLILR